MRNIFTIVVRYWQDAWLPALITKWFFLVRNAAVLHMRYRGELHEIDRGSLYFGGGPTQWRIAGVWFNSDSIAWMIDNAIAYPFTREDLVLYTMTWGLGRE